MNRIVLLRPAVLPIALLSTGAICLAQTSSKPAAEQKVVVQGKPEAPLAAPAPPDSTTDGTVSVGGQRIVY